MLLKLRKSRQKFFVNVLHSHASFVCFLLTILCWFCKGMTKVKLGKEESTSADFVERRRASLER